MTKARGRHLILVGVALACTFPATAAADVATYVEVYNNFFDPRETRIDPGEAVVWIAQSSGHTVTADDGRFDLPTDRLMRRGEVVSHTFTTEETVPYYCKVHGRPGGFGMSGVIVVGAGDPPPAPPPTSPPERVVPTETYPDIASALSDAPPGTTISLLPGVYRERVTLIRPGLTLRSDGDAILDGDGAQETGVSVEADDVTLSGLSVHDNLEVGIAVRGVRGATIDRVDVASNRDVGVRVEASREVGIRDIHVTGSGIGIHLIRCPDCDIIVERVTAEGNGAGIAIADTDSVIVRTSTLRHNGVGLAVRNTDQQRGGGHIWRNEIESNVVHDVPQASSGPLDVRVGVGIWLDGARHYTVEENTITGHRYAVALTGFGGPSRDTRITQNVTSVSSVADLGWDGLGAETCFAANRTAEGAEPSSQPPAIEVLYPCSRATAGLPYPRVDADILVASVRR